MVAVPRVDLELFLHRQANWEEQSHLWINADNAQCTALGYRLDRPVRDDGWSIALVPVLALLFIAWRNHLHLLLKFLLHLVGLASSRTRVRAIGINADRVDHAISTQPSCHRHNSLYRIG